MSVRDRLVVPGLGVFSASTASASFSAGCLVPPHRVISFHYDEATADSGGVLEASMRRCNCADALGADVAAVISELQASGLSEFGALGTLVFDTHSGEVLFENGDNGLLPSLPLTPLRHTGEPESVQVAAPAASQPQPRGLFWASSTAAALVIAAFITFFVNFFASHEQSHATMATLAPAAVTESAVQQPSLPLKIVFNTPADASCEVAPKSSVLTPRPGDYCLVVASLASEAEASQFIAAHSASGCPLGILLKDGRFRVIAATGSGFAECQSNGVSNGATALFASSWICRN